MGLPKISHTAEAFWALNILPIRKLRMFNVIKIFFFNLEMILFEDFYQQNKLNRVVANNQ